MTTWISGRESQHLDAIIDGRKTVEGRLNRGKFAEYSVGDIVSLRRDIRGDDGVLRDGDEPEIEVEVAYIHHYPDSLAMVTAEGFSNVIPSAKTAREAADAYNMYYSVEDQAKYGVLAIGIKPRV